MEGHTPDPTGSTPRSRVTGPLLVWAIRHTITETDYEYYGLRIDDGPFGEVGDTAPLSRVWVDGDPTDRLLDGTSSIVVTSDSIDEALSMLIDYLGDRLTLLGSYYSAWGEDRGEIVMRNATILWTARVDLTAWADEHGWIGDPGYPEAER